MDDHPEELPWRVRAGQLIARARTFISWTAAIVIWPFEFCLGIFVRLMVGGVSRVENTNNFMSWALWWLFAPFRGVWFVCRRLLSLIRDYLILPLEVLFFKATRLLFGAVDTAADHTFVFTRVRWAIASRWQKTQETVAESSGVASLLRAVIAAPFLVAGSLFFLLIHAFMWTAELLNLDGVLARLIYWTRPLWYPLASLGGFAWSWFVTRNRWQMFWGIPLFLALLPGAWLLAENVLWGKSRIADQYRSAVALAREAKTLDRLHLFERKLAQLGVNTEATTFNTAVALAREGKIDDAYQRMSTIAPVDRPGYASAHFWIIQQILLDHINIPVETGNSLAESHFRQLASLGHKEPEINLLRAFWLARCNKSAEAAELLAPLVHLYPAAAVERMRLNMLLERINDARQDAAVVEDFMEQSQRNGKTLTSDEYQAWCVAEDLLLHVARVRTILDEWLKFDPANKEARELQSRLNAQTLTQSFADSAATSDQLAANVRQAFAAESASAEVREQVFDLYRKRSTTLSHNMAFDQLVRSNDLSTTLADVLGTAAAGEEDWATAEPLFEQVVREQPNNMAASNNLAYVLLERGGDLTRALAAANSAVQSNPANLHFRETRGQILAKLGRWQEAIDDLEFAVNGIPDAPGIHDALAKAYEAVGNGPLAASHRLQAGSR